MNDLPSNITDSELFADDTNLIVKSLKNESLKVTAERKIAEATVWLQNNELVLNEAKSVLIEFLKGSGGNLNTITNKINNSQINKKDSTAFLGIVIDSQLNWHDHINKLKKLNSGFYAIKTIKTITDINTTKLVYFSNFESHIRYGIEFWGGSTSCDKIFKLQKKVIRSMLNKNQRTHCRPLFRRLNILTLYSLYILNSALQILKKS